ncbi:MAG: ExbD/TolR family protein [Arenicella sp.]
MFVNLSSKRKPKPIGLTALIDAVFILLLFFMLSSTFVQHNSITLNTTQNSHIEQSDVKPQLLILNNDGSVALFQESIRPVSPTTLLKRLNPLEPVVVLPVADVTVQKIVSLLSQIESSGFNLVSLGQTIDSNDQ